jgi:acetamidase/formamidase/AraC-like DNA-binding protein
MPDDVPPDLAFGPGLAAMGLVGALDRDAAFDVVEVEAGARLARLRCAGAALDCVPAGADAPVLLMFAVTGRGAIAAAGRHPAFADGDLVALDLGQPWRLSLTGRCEVVFVRLPRDGLRQRMPRHALRLPAVLGASAAADAARPVMRAAGANFARLGAEPFGPLEIALTELVAAALTQDNPRAADATDVQAGHLRRVRLTIERRLRDPELTLDVVAREERMSRRYLQRLFAQAGETFSDHLRARRLAEARRDLADPRLAGVSVREIAHRAGFTHHAHFSRAFRAAFGHSPSDARAGSADRDAPAHRGRPDRLPPRSPPAPPAAALAAPPRPTRPDPAQTPARLPLHPSTVHWGYLSRHLPPVLHLGSGERVVIETVTQHGGDDRARMIDGDAAVEAVFAWTREGKAVDRRGAGPMSASIFGRGAGEGFGVHILSGPIFVEGAEPGDWLTVTVLQARPRPCADPAFAGRAFASSAAAWWGYQYGDLTSRPARREAVTIYETDAEGGDGWATPVHSFRWTPQTDPFGVVHSIMDYPGVIVDPATVRPVPATPGLRVPMRPHFGFVGVAPAEADMVDSIPPGRFGGNIDNWRAGVGSTVILPISVPGALLSIGDPHFAQGDGEISGTALEGSLTGEFRIGLIKRDAAPERFEAAGGPFVETADAFILIAFSYPNYLRDLGGNAQAEIYTHATLDRAMRNAWRQSRDFLRAWLGVTEDEAVSLISIAVDFGVTQLVDGNIAVHASVPKALNASSGDL